MSSSSATSPSRTRRALVVGGGAREHAIVRALVRAGADMVVAPGNPGIAEIARTVNVAADDVPGLTALAQKEGVDLVVVGPEKPLTMGLADALRAAGIPTFGPGRVGAELEGSKAFMKEFLRRHGIPTAPFRVFDDADAALEFVKREARPLVVKADGLAAGKGVVVATDVDEACEAVRAMMIERAFGAAGARVVIEDVLPGEEASFHVLCSVSRDGISSVSLPAAQDHKRVFDGDRGPNTGGMGAYAPAPVVTSDVLAKIESNIVTPTLRGLAADGIDYRGVLFIGLMIEHGEPRVLEFNVRFGDPEATVILPMLGAHAWDVLAGAARGALPANVTCDTARAALSVVLAAEHYPQTPAAGDVIRGTREAGATDRFVHHAGTRIDESGQLVTAGGRVLTVTGEGPTLAQAKDAAYAAAAAIHFRGMHFRKDIGFRALARAE